MEKIVGFMKCGKVYKYGGKYAVSFTIVDLTYIKKQFYSVYWKTFYHRYKILWFSWLM